MTNRINFTGASTPQTVELQGMMNNFVNATALLNTLLNEVNQADYGSDTAAVQAMLGCATTSDATALLSILSAVQTYLNTPGNVFLEMLGRIGN
jgi:hypothetical protein